ncbi:MAG: hypothetical protein ACP5XB_10760 [Isosphaeraceae bacterium]
MCSTSRSWFVTGLSATTLILLGSLANLAGCNPRTDQLRPDNLFARIGHRTGEVIEPRKCMLRVAILDRALGDPAINEAVWKVADEQVIAPEARRALEVNGLRIGVITGEPPPELESVLLAPPPHKVEPATFLLDEGDPTLISISAPIDQVTLLVNRDNRPYGKDYQRASGYFRVTANHDGTNKVGLRLTPEIHHGAFQRSFQPTPYSPQQFKISDGQQTETLGDLSAFLTLEPGQAVVVGCRPEQKRSLGSFLLTQGEANAEQRRQKLVMVWASRNQLGAIGEKPTKSDRPQPSTKPLVPDPRNKAASPAPPTKQATTQ